MDDLISDFVIETNDNLNHLHTDITALKQTPNADNLAGIFRFFHTVKGSCAFLSFTHLAKLAHHTENLLTMLRDTTAPVTDEHKALIFESIKNIKDAVVDIEKNGQEPNDKYDNLIKRLDAASIGKKTKTSPIRAIYDIMSAIKITNTELPLSNAFKKLPAVIDDLNDKLGKKITLDIKEENLTLAASVVEQLKAPLLHMVRNAADHGIETPQERMASGKDEIGTILIEAYEADGHTVIKISDDGKGINQQNIKDEIVRKGLASEDAIASMNEQDILGYIFKSGISSAKEVSDISGRGVGMDVAFANITDLGGTIEIKTTPEKGCCFTIKIPD